MIRTLLPALPLLLGACSGVQTPLDPHGGQAARIAGLSWLLFIGGTAIFGLVMALLAWALFAPARLRDAMRSRGFVIGGGIVFPVVTLAALLAHSLGISRALVLPREDQPLRIEVIGRQYWWEVRYPDSGEHAVTANEIRLPVGREVELLLASGDVIKVAEVVRDLSRRDADRGLSAGEKRMLAKARQILVSELALAEHTEEEKAEAILDEVLAS